MRTYRYEVSSRKNHLGTVTVDVLTAVSDQTPMPRPSGSFTLIGRVDWACAYEKGHE